MIFGYETTVITYIKGKNPLKQKEINVSSFMDSRWNFIVARDFNGSTYLKWFLTICCFDFYDFKLWHFQTVVHYYWLGIFPFQSQFFDRFWNWNVRSSISWWRKKVYLFFEFSLLTWCNFHRTNLIIQWKFGEIHHTRKP